MADIEESINRAIQEGKFDNLSGKGKPLNLDDDPHADPEWRLAYHVLKNGGYTLPWIELRQEIDAEIDTARKTLRRAWEWRQDRLDRRDPPAAIEAEWQRARRAFVTELERINKRIFDYNLQTPSDKFQLLVLNPEREIDRILSS